MSSTFKICEVHFPENISTEAANEWLKTNNKLKSGFRNKDAELKDGYRVYKQKNVKKGAETFSCVIDPALGIKAIYDLSGKRKDVLQRQAPRGNPPNLAAKKRKALELEEQQKEGEK